MNSLKRLPVVAGQFYPSSATALSKEVRSYTKTTTKPKKVTCAIVPHAGYVYSGAVAGKVFAEIEVPNLCFVLSPNHTGLGEVVSVWPGGSWEIPTGELEVDHKVVEQFLKKCPSATPDKLAHLREHSLEVLLPFIFEKNSKAKIVPITLGHANLKTCNEVGVAIAEILKNRDDAMIIVSTDMNHYESQMETVAKDKLAIERVLALDPEGLLRICASEGITMCGVVSVATALFACGELGCTNAKLVEHKTSGDVSKDFDSVVGYAGFIIT